MDTSKDNESSASCNVEGDGVIDLSSHKIKVTSIVKQLINLNMLLTVVQLKEYDITELSVRLEFVENLNKAFEKAQSILEENDSSELEGSTRYNFAALYFEVKAKLARQLNLNRKIESNQHSSTVRQFSIDETPTHPIPHRVSRLPELKIPQFSGSYMDWPDFFAMFSTVIDSDNELSKIEKFQHLRASLRDAALDTISSLEPTEANYTKAIDLLKNRFDNKLLNFQTHIKEIFGLKGVEKDSAASLRQLSDKLNAHMRALQTIGTQEQIADGPLVHLITSKLDPKSQIKWEENLPINKLPTWTPLSHFWSVGAVCWRIYMLPNQQISKKTLSHGRNVLVTSAAPTLYCSFCDSREHYIQNCVRFGNLSPTLRFKEVKRLQLCLNCLRKGHMMKNCKSGHCRYCPSKHHSLLHINNAASPSSVVSTSPPADLAPATTISQSTLISSLSSSPPPDAQESPSGFNVLLATAVVLVKNRSGSFAPCRAILDSASQLNFITGRLSNQLHLSANKSCVTISGIGDGTFVADKSVDVSVKSQYSDYSTSFSAVVVPNITDYQPSVNINVNGWNIPKNIQLADPKFYKPSRVDILIGAGLFFELMCVGQIRLAKNLPLLQKTLFGWVVSGGGFYRSNSCSLAATCKFIQKEEDNLNILVKRFWEVESHFDGTILPSNDDAICENHFQKTTIRLGSGAYSVSLPKRKEGVMLGDSYQRALKRFECLEKKLNKHPDIKKQYSDFMKEYLELRHMSLVSSPLNVNTYYLPHHCVHKLESTTTKLRVVFDGSAKTSSGLSLNDILYSGPTIQSKLFNILLRFRFFKVALSGDICKMYRCVRVSHPDDYLQCILWRENSNEDIKVYKLDTVTYGTKPAAYLAIRSMHQLSIDEGHIFPLGAKIVRQDFYVDDMISGGDTVADVIQIRQQVAALLQRGNFMIRKWCSNDPAALHGVPPSDCEQFLKFHDGTDITKTLGLMWDPKTDSFIFSFMPVVCGSTVTKRSVLSAIARLYDPLGLIGPIITKAKVFMQILWKNKVQWDESLPQKLHSAWLDFMSKFSIVHSFTFPRFVSISKATVQIHAFCDASLSAYGTCIYARSELDGVVKTCLLCSKSRVSPLKTLTVPKLELSAALLLAELIDAVINSFSTRYEVHCWSDSMVVLSWLREEPSNFNVFVSNRVSRIQSLTNKMTWHHVPTNLNPADILSRGAAPEELLNSKLWKNGPEFLCSNYRNWPKNVNFLAELPELRRSALVTTQLYDWSAICKHHNSFGKMQRIFGYVYKFVILKLKLSKNKELDNLTPFDLKMGTHMLIRNIQQIYFAPEYKALKANKDILPSSKLYSLTPFVDSTNLIRVGGRLKNSTLDFDARHPIILPKLHHFTRALVMHFHQKFLHSGPQCLLASIRQQYWPLGGRKAVSKIILKCVRCFRLKPKYTQHIMGNLPQDRVQANRVFLSTGVDFCGPFYYKSEVRNRPPVKCYICIFVCFSTKALHLEVVSDLSTQSFLAALKRFICTRGKPKTIWSDNATNFVGARNELEELKQLFLGQSHLQQVHQHCLEDGIDWKFIPPRSPHFGGLWEAAVKAAKYHFNRTVGLSILTFDELRTLVIEISAILNSRPLCPISEDPGDLDVLTPAHFLVGSAFTAIVEPEVTDINVSRLNRWQRVCFMKQKFWKKWSTSYLTLLQERSKWRASTPNIAIGAMVLLKDENLPPLKWQLGRVVELICGGDGVVRVAVVRTSNGTIKRAVAKMAVLPIDDNSVESQGLPTGGECS